MNYKDYFKQRLLEQMGNSPYSTGGTPNTNLRPLIKPESKPSPRQLLLRSARRDPSTGIHPESPLGQKILSGQPFGTQLRRP